MLIELQQLFLQMGKENMNSYLKSSLEPIARLANQADLLDWNIPIISVTGTNGKGSTVAALRSIYQANGYRVGVFTSPHLMTYNERIAINGELISDSDLLHSTQYVFELDKAQELSFFPKMFLIALHYFKSQALDALILEVGCGGRLDAINILDADLVIVSSVDLDHQAFLGDTIESIAKEKAGLFRQNQCAIFADKSCPNAILETAQHLNVKLLRYAKDYVFEVDGASWALSFDDKRYTFSYLPKVHIQAMLSALVAARVLQQKLPVTELGLEKAVQQVFIPGRLQWLQYETPTLLDVSHNPHAVNLLVQHLQTKAISGRIHAVFSVLKDKDGCDIVKIFNKLTPLWYTTSLDSERSHSQESLEHIFQMNQIQHHYFATPKQALISAQQNAKPGDCIVVFGSFLIVSNIMSHLKQEHDHVF